MKRLWLLGAVLAVGLFAVGCGKSESEKALEDAAKKMQESQAKTDEMLKGAKDLTDKTFEDAGKKLEEAGKKIDEAGKDAAETIEKAKEEGDKKADEIKDAANKLLEGVKKPD